MFVECEQCHGTGGERGECGNCQGAGQRRALPATVTDGHILAVEVCDYLEPIAVSLKTKAEAELLAITYLHGASCAFAMAGLNTREISALQLASIVRTVGLIGLARIADEALKLGVKSRLAKQERSK